MAPLRYEPSGEEKKPLDLVAESSEILGWWEWGCCGKSIDDAQGSLSSSAAKDALDRCALDCGVQGLIECRGDDYREDNITKELPIKPT